MCKCAIHVLQGAYKHKHEKDSLGLWYDPKLAPVYRKALEIVAKEHGVLLKEGESVPLKMFQLENQIEKEAQKLLKKL